MSVVRISGVPPTPAERQGLDRLQKRRDAAELELNTAINSLRTAQQAKARARRDYTRALDELTRYRERTGM